MTEGLTITVPPKMVPGSQVYETAPPAVSVDMKVGQIEVGEATAVSVGP